MRTNAITRALRRTGDLPPGQRRFYPAPRGMRAQLRDNLRWALVRPNRADRRHALRLRQAGPGADVAKA